MASLDVFFPRLLQFEGGFVNDPDDPGGATNKGITLATLEHYADRLGITPTIASLRALSDEQALRIYKAGYWDPLYADEIADQPLAEIVFDFHVNAGAAAVRLLQRALNEIGTKPPLVIDGAMGPVTVRAVLSADALVLYRAYKHGRIDYYRDLVRRRPELTKFLNGWLRRVNSFPDR